ncbi:L-lactate dehydrogenase complex protein LldG [Kibdelosporangium banguiense]|uniref:L-lactate dehydrogenase complex protein LldG n=1 Tax=Kibdelosporangium banguiense TaxID=1365924 RepID=A0ABS4TD46_9PSEU|nr:LUD domain-containing protein [Kibdelosporangium banguiense]MBP2321746.1 L-lactate dehydrogenase complex protein LldG [Kibdelosporangium banguiense]
MAESSKELILQRIRTALGPRRPAVEIPREYQRTRDFPSVLDLFAERVADYRAVVHVVTDPVAEIRTLLAGRSIVAPDDVPAEWLVPEVTWLREPLSVTDLDSSDGVLTGCAVGIAETGTIVLDGGVAQGRRALTLLPDYHLCVVQASQVAGTVAEALERLDPVRPLTFVSGPSATSDIEMDRVEGVHGPRTLEVLIVQ